MTCGVMGASPPRPRQVAAVLFDLDGVLVDTQDVEIEALLLLAGELSPRLPEDQDLRQLLAGRKMQEAVDMIASFCDRAPPKDAVAQVRQTAERLLAGRLRLIPGVVTALRQIRLPKHVVSNSPLDLIQKRLADARIAGHFTSPHFSAYEYHVWKPDPALYRHALEHLDIPPEAAIAIEDSAVGVEAAQAAGLWVYWYSSKASPDVDVPRVLRLEAMSALPRLIRAVVEG